MLDEACQKTTSVRFRVGEAQELRYDEWCTARQMGYNPPLVLERSGEFRTFGGSAGGCSKGDADLWPSKSSFNAPLDRRLNMLRLLWTDGEGGSGACCTPDSFVL